MLIPLLVFYLSFEVPPDIIINNHIIKLLKVQDVTGVLTSFTYLLW
nr:MAG TPA: hypothetical protein [Caudoviricetes sp.]